MKNIDRQSCTLAQKTFELKLKIASKKYDMDKNFHKPTKWKYGTRENREVYTLIDKMFWDKGTVFYREMPTVDSDGLKLYMPNKKFILVSAKSKGDDKIVAFEAQYLGLYLKSLEAFEKIKWHNETTIESIKYIFDTSIFVKNNSKVDEKALDVVKHAGYRAIKKYASKVDLISKIETEKNIETKNSTQSIVEHLENQINKICDELKTNIEDNLNSNISSSMDKAPTLRQ